MLSVIHAKAMLRQHEQKTATTNLPARRMLNSAIARGATSLDAAVVRDVWAGLSGGGMAERDALKVELAALDEKLKVLKKEINDKEKIEVLQEKSQRQSATRRSAGDLLPKSAPRPSKSEQ